MDNETEETLVQVLVKELRCKSCSCQLTPPLFQCYLAHHECSRCMKLFEKCSECSFTRNSRRNYFLERLCFGTTLKCSFANKGCLFSNKAIEVAAHEKSCNFGVIANKASKFVKDDFGKTVEESEPNKRADVEKDSPGEFMEDVIVSALQCPVCLTRILPPIKECQNGHQICTECYFRTTVCPVCRGPKIFQIENFLDQIFERLEVRCKNAGNGCQIRKKGRSIVSHEILCEYAFRPCPLSENIECRWEGFKYEFLDHCMKNHVKMICLGSESGWVMRNFNKRYLPVFNLLFVNGVMFKCCWENYGSLIRFSVYHIEGERNMTSYTFNLEIPKPGPDIEFVVFRGECFPVRSIHNRLMTSFHVDLTEKSVLYSCDIHGDFRFVIKINKSV